MLELILSIIFFPIAVVIWVIKIIMTIWLTVEGSNRRCGGAVACLVSIFISPLVAAIIVFTSQKVESQVFQVIPQQPQVDKLDQLTKLAQLKASGLLSDEELEVEKAKIMNAAENPGIITVQATQGERTGIIAVQATPQVLTAGLTELQYVEEGIAFMQKENFQQAMNAYNNAIGLNPSFANAYYRRALLHVAMNQPEKALSDYTTVITLDPVNAPAYNNRGKLYAQLGKKEDAFRDIKKAADFGFAPAQKWIESHNTSVS